MSKSSFVRGNIICKGQCTGCTCCYNVCPVKAIEMMEDAQGFLRPTINEEICIKCGLCRKTCPINNSLDKIFNPASKIAYAAKALDHNVQLKCTSGGVFTTLAYEAIERGWIVYGAGYDEQWHVCHRRIDSKDDIYKLSESKYAQSIIGDIYKKVETDLKEHPVLFSGTSCQIAGLHGYLKRNYDNLVCVDVVCHGIPSPGIWNWYIDQIKNKYQSDPIFVRHKGKYINGWSWKRQFISIAFSNKTEFRENIWKNSFMKGFLHDLYLRESCHSCKFKNPNIKRVADITLADYWGCEEIEKDFYDMNGVSLVLINSQKGQKFFLNDDRCLKKQTNLFRALTHNTAVIRAYRKNIGRLLFYKRFDYSMTLDEFSNLIDKCVRWKLLTEKWNFLHKMRRVIGKIWRCLEQKQHQKT